MTEEIKQAVVETTEPVAEPTDPKTSARDESLDTLLEEYDRSIKAKSTPEPTPDPQYAPEEVDPRRIRAIEERLFKEDVESTLTRILESVDVKVPRRAAIGWVDQMARENPHIARAFLNRQQDPTSWRRMERALSREMEKEFKSLQVDEQATADREAVTASLKGASTRVTADPPLKMGNMSNAEYRRTIAEKFGFDPGV